MTAAPRAPSPTKRAARIAAGVLVGVPAGAVISEQAPAQAEICNGPKSCVFWTGREECGDRGISTWYAGHGVPSFGAIELHWCSWNNVVAGVRWGKGPVSTPINGSTFATRGYKDGGTVLWQDTHGLDLQWRDDMRYSNSGWWTKQIDDAGVCGFTMAWNRYDQHWETTGCI